VRRIFPLKLLTILVVSLSLSGLPTVLSKAYFPSVPVARAAPAPVEQWYPAGPSSNTLQVSIFAGAVPESAALFAAPPLIDAMDVPTPPPPPPPAGCAGNPDYFLTASGYCYTSYWHRVIDGGAATGTFNFFTPLNAYSTGACINPGCGLAALPPSPPIAAVSAGTFREGFSAATTGLNPYNAPVTPQNHYILHSVYDQLYRPNPMNAAQLLDWMTINSVILLNPDLTYAPPPGTTLTIRNTLRPDIFWQDGSRLDTRDVVFSYLSLIATGSPQIPPAMICPSPTCLMTGITLVNQIYTQFDINLSGIAAPTKQDLGSVTILPGHIWSACAPGWNAFNPPAFSIFPLPAAGCTLAAPGLVGAGVDPLIAVNPNTGASGILIGSGPWSCQNTGANPAVAMATLGTGCSSSNTQAPPIGGTFTLTRYGCTLAGGTSCLAPASSLITYFRSAGNLALYIWSGNIGVPTSDFTTFAMFAPCFGHLVGTAGCTHWQEGVGNPSVTPISITQAGILSRFFGVNWVQPFTWTTGPPTSIGAYPPALYEKASPALDTLNPKALVGCFLPGNGGGAVANYPVGGYDC